MANRSPSVVWGHLEHSGEFQQMKLGNIVFLRGRGLVLAGLMALVVAAAPLAADAHFLGGSWWYGGRLLPLSYQNNTGGFPAYPNSVNQAATNRYFTPRPCDLHS